MQDIKKISQKIFFTEYNKYNETHRDHKDRITKHGIYLGNKIILTYGNKDKSKDLLNNIAIRIQKRINRGELTRYDMARYRSEVVKLILHTPNYNQDLEGFFKCCIILSKHSTKDENKLNYFWITI